LSTLAEINAAPATPVGLGWRHPHYAEVLQALPPVDFLQVHSENFFATGGAALAVLRQGRAHYPISLHGVGLGLGSAVGVDPWHLKQLGLLVEQSEPIRVSDHACFARGHLNGADVHAADLLPIPFTDTALDVLCANVQRVQEHLQRQLLIENLSAYVNFTDDTHAETDFLNQLVQRTGCGLLVDVNNIYVNALNAQRAGSDAEPMASCIAWLNRISADAVGEIHLAGHIDTGRMVIDDHGSRVCDAVWQIYRHAQLRFGQVPALMEWDTDIPPLAVLLGEAELARAACAA
jgi:uncharacterized protein